MPAPLSHTFGLSHGLALGSAAVLAALAPVSGCGTTRAPTSITVNVRTDLACDDLKNVSIAVGAAQDLDTRPAQTTTSTCTPLNEELSSVGTLVIVPSGALDAEVGIRVLGGITRIPDRCTADTGFRGCIVARRIARFVPEREIEITIDLRVACVDVSCDAANTCIGRQCLSASVDSSRCLDAPCGDDVLARPDAPDASVDGAGEDAGPLPCASDEKTCSGSCVKTSTPENGCSLVGCAPCPGSDRAAFSCDQQRCVRGACKPGFKLCGDSCVPSDPAHGCDNATCAPCQATNGTAGCSGGACTLQCALGSKLCGGRCVNVDDPTYGCGATACSAASCPDPGSGGTLVCNAGTCAIGACPPNTKACGQRCVPTDANNGCADAQRCTACNQGDVCLGQPSTCQCQPETLLVTCASKACGPATNNCGQTVTCPDNCSTLGKGFTCGGASSGLNGCGCTPDNVTACASVPCGRATNNCGQLVECPNTCPTLGPQYFCKARYNVCDCTPIDKTTACANKKCGPAPDGCGANYNCGNCLYGRICDCGGHCVLPGTICP